MHKEHEEAMRRDFTQYSKLTDTINAVDATTAEGEQRQALAQAIAQRDEIALRWECGLHAPHWDDLVLLEGQYRKSPTETLRWRDRIREQFEDYPKFVDERNLEQATELAFDRMPQLREISAEAVRESAAKPGVERSR